MASNIPHDDILHEILLRLPVKSLSRFKAVCKQWRALITDPQFVKLHVNFSHSNHSIGRLHMSGYTRSYCYEPMEIDEDPRTTFRFGCCHKIIHGPRELPWYVSLTSNNSQASDIQEVEIDYPFNDPLDRVTVLGSCNGLLLIGFRYYEIFLWNPTTKEHKMVLPESNMSKSDSHWCIRNIYGLGYVSSLDEYKVIIFAAECNKDRVKSHMFILSLRTGRWKVDVNYDLPYSISNSWCTGLTVNGSPHWVVKHSGEDHYSIHNVVIYFDMVDEKFKRVPTPTSWCNYKFTVEMAVLGGCLTTVHHNVDDTGSFDVWTMKEYGAKESWTKLFSIHHSTNYLKPLGFTNNGDEVVVQINLRKLVTYNLKTKEEKFLLGTSNNIGGFRSVEYVESLVSPLALGQR